MPQQETPVEDAEYQRAGTVEALAALHTVGPARGGWLPLFFGCLGVLVVVLGGLWLMLDRWAWSGSIDYSKLPPAEVFRKVTGQTVPTGITELRAAGRSGAFGMRQWVWISFRANQAAINALTAGAEPLEPAARGKLLALPATVMRYVAEDQRRVGWSDVDPIEHPQYYQCGNSGERSAAIWVGTLVIDRKGGRGFIQSFGD